MGVKFSNNGHSTLAASAASNATSITVASGHGARFPSLSSGEYFYATLIDSSNNLEIVKCTARSSDVLTITRAQESTSGRAFVSGDRLELRVTAQAILDATSAAVDIDAGTIDLGSTISTGIRVHTATISSNVTIASTQNGVAAGPLTISAIVTVSGDLAIV